MNKDFDQWNKLKKKLDTKKDLPLFREREVWWCSLGHNVGFEQDGKGVKFQRPVLVLRKFNKYVFTGIPSTGNTSKKSELYSYVTTQEDSFNLILSQVRLFDSRRLSDRIVTLPWGEFKKVQKDLRKVFKI